MIRSLRRRHRQIFLILTLLLPVVFIAGLIVRRQIPAAPAFQKDSGSKARNAAFYKPIEWEDAGISLAAGSDLLDVIPAGKLPAPDLLLYWSPRQSADGVPGSEAELLGPIDGARAQSFSLPAAARDTDGFLMAWSLTHRRLIAVRPWPKGGYR